MSQIVNSLSTTWWTGQNQVLLDLFFGYGLKENSTVESKGQVLVSNICGFVTSYP